MNAPVTSLMSLGLKWTQEYHGPNPYAEAAVVVGEISAQALADRESILRARADLWAWSGMEQSQAEELSEGCEVDSLLLLGQTAAAWALAALNEVRGFLAHAGAEGTGDSVRLWVGFHHAQLSRDAVQLALRSLIQSLKGELYRAELTIDLQRLWQACRRHHPDYQARILMVGAREMGVPYLPFLPGTKYWQYGWGAKARVFMESSSNQDGTLGQQWQRNKVTAKAVMNALGLPSPVHVLVTREEQIQATVARVGFPCVLKPLDSGGGKGVTANVRSMNDAITAFRVAYRQNQGPVLVEKHVQGDDHRLMVIDGQFVAAIRREPSFVVGDGEKSVAALVAELNNDRSSNMVRSRYLRPIALDEVLERHLATQSLTLGEVLPLGRRVTLRSNANLSTGGICTDLTPICHPQVRAMAVVLAKSVGLATAGIDYLTTDITRPPSETGGAFIEMNTTPGLDACVAAGWNEADIARLVLGPEVGRIPVALTVVGHATLAQECSGGLSVSLEDGEGWVCGDDLRVGSARLHNTSPQPWAAVQAALRNQRLTRLQVVCTPADIQRHGLPVDRFEYVQVESADLPEPWLELLKRVSKHGVTFSQSMHEPSPVG